MGGALDNDLHINRNKFYYDNTMSTSDLCQRERIFQKSTFDCAKRY